MLRAQLGEFEEALERLGEPVRLAQDLSADIGEYRRIVGEARAAFSKDDYGVAVRVEADTKRVTADIEAVELWRRLCVYVTPENFKLASVDVLELNFVILRRLMEAISFADMDGAAQLRCVVDKLKNINTPIDSLHQSVTNVDSKGNLVPLVPKTVDVIQKHMETLYENWIYHLTTSESDISLTAHADAASTQLFFRFCKVVRRSTNYVEGIIGSLVRHRGAMWRTGLYAANDRSIYSLAYQDEPAGISPGSLIDAMQSNEENLDRPSPQGPPEVRRITRILNWLQRFLTVELTFAKTLYHIVACDCHCLQCSSAAPDGTPDHACTCNLSDKTTQMLKIDTPESYVQMIFNGELLVPLHSTWRQIAPGFNISEICGLRLPSTPSMPSNSMLGKESELTSFLVLLFVLRQTLQEHLLRVRDMLAKEEKALMVEYLSAIERNVESLYNRGIEQICEDLGEMILDWENPQVPGMVRHAVGLVGELSRASRDEEQLREAIDRICNTVVNSARVQAEVSGSCGYHLLCNVYDFLGSALQSLHPALVEVLGLLSEESALRLAVKEACVFLSTYDLMKYVRVNKLTGTVELASREDAGVAGSLLLFCRSMDKLYLPELTKITQESTRALVQRTVNQILSQAFVLLFDTLPAAQQAVLPYNKESFSNLTKT